MKAQNNAAQVAVQAAACPDESPVDLHALYRQQSQCGYDNPLTLLQCEAADMAASLRGLIAVTAVLQAATDSDGVVLGDWIKGGLHDALHQLARDAQATLEHANTRTEKTLDKRKGGAV